MKTFNQGWKLALFLAIFIFSCENDPTDLEGNSGKILVQFETATKQVFENSGQQTVVVKLDNQPSGNAILTLKTENSFEENFNTVPPIENGLIKIYLAKGMTQAELKLLPKDNSVKDGHRTASLAVNHVSLPFITGANNPLKIAIIDDETPGEGESVANFIHQDITLAETNTLGVEYQIYFSEVVSTDSEVKVALASENGNYGADYVSVPAAQNNVITLPVAAGAKVISFKVRPVNNNYITGEMQIILTLSETTGSITKGNVLRQTLSVRDDELHGKPRGYELTAGNTIIKKFIDYDVHARISKVKWEYYTPYLNQETHTYYYEDNGQLTRINKAPGREVLYRWENDRIVRSEQIRNGIMLEYTEYKYNDTGKIEGVISYYPRGDGTFQKGLMTVYLWFTDGNLYKTLTYDVNNDSEQQPQLISTRTYDNYLEKPSPFDMTEVLPTVKLQRNLPGTYRVEESGIDLTYHLTYEFREDGLPDKRMANGPDLQTAAYHYY